MRKSFSILFILLSVAQYSFGQLHRATQKEFQTLNIYSENGDFKAGKFYASKIEKFIKKKTGENSLESLLLNCYQAQFLLELDDSKKANELLKTIDNQLTSAYRDTNISAMLKVYKQHVKLFDLSGIYTKSDKLYEAINKQRSSLLAFEREQLDYYKLYTDYKKGYLNEVSKACPSHIDKILTLVENDSLYTKNGLELKKLKKNEILNRNLLAGKFLTLQLQAMLDNGLSDSVNTMLFRQEAYFHKAIGNKRGFMAEFHYLKGQYYLQQIEYKDAEKEFRSAAAIAKSFYLQHSTPITDIYHGLITSLLGQDKNEEADYYINDIAVKVYGYYGKNSLGFQHNKYNDAEVLLINRKWDAAEKEIIDFLSSSLLPEVHEYRSVALADLYTVYLRIHDFKLADSTLRLLITLKEELTGTNNPASNYVKLKQAVLYSHYLDRFNESDEIFKAIVNDTYLTHISLSNPEYYFAIASEAKLYEYKEDYKKAFEIINSSLASTKKVYGNKSEAYARLLNLLAALEITTGKYTDANNDINTSIEVFKSKNSKSSVKYYAEALEIKARLKIIEGEYKEAEELLDAATLAYSKISRLVTDDNFSIEEIGLLYIKTGKYSKAEKYLKKLLSEKEAGLGKDHKSTYSILNYLGELNVVLGNYSDADNYFERSTKITKKTFGDKSIPYANSLVYYKKLYAVLGDPKSAAKALKTAIEIYKKAYGEDNVKVGILMHEYALASLEESLQRKSTPKEKTELTATLQKSLEIIKAKLTAESPAYANALEDASLFYVYANEPKKSIAYIEEAKNIWAKKLGDPNIHSAELEMLTGRIYYKMESYTESLFAFEKSKNNYENLFDKNHPLYITALGKCAQLYYILNQKNKAIESIEYCVEKSLYYMKTIFPILSEGGKAAYWEKTKEDFEFYKTLTFNSDNVKADMVNNVFNMQLQTRSILLNSQLKVKQQVLTSGDTTLIRLYNALILNRENLALGYSMTQAERKEAGVEVSHLEATNDKLEKELSGISSLFNTSKTKEVEYDWKSLKKQLESDELIIEITPFRLFTTKFSDTTWYAILALDGSSGTTNYVLLKNGKELQNKFLTNYRNCMKFSVEDKYSYTYYWRPILPLLKPKHKKIYFVRDGVYNQINPETFQDDAGNYLINSTNIRYIGTSRDLFSREKSSKKSDKSIQPEISLIGNPIYYSDGHKGSKQVDQLPGSEREVVKIDSLLRTNSWKSTILINGEASEESIKAISNPKVLHISTHGFFAEEKNQSQDELRETAVDNPLLRSGLLMKEGGELLEFANINIINKTDGILTAYEVLNLTLDKTDLVVLSACETGLGEVQIGEGVLGLQRSFEVAGAKSVIMSIFKVSDEVTQKLMLSFYKNWLITGNKYESFMLAKKEIMKNHNEPIYWGSFVMVGIN